MNHNVLALLTGVSAVSAFLPRISSVNNGSMEQDDLEGLRLGLGMTAIVLLITGALLSAESKSTVPFGISAVMGFVVWSIYEMRANGYAIPE